MRPVQPSASPARCNPVRRGATRSGPGATRANAVRPDRRGAARTEAARPGPTRRGAARPGPARYGRSGVVRPVRRGAVQCGRRGAAGPAQRFPARYDPVQRMIDFISPTLRCPAARIPQCRGSRSDSLDGRGPHAPLECAGAARSTSRAEQPGRADQPREPLQVGDVGVSNPAETPTSPTLCRSSPPTHPARQTSPTKAKPAPRKGKPARRGKPASIEAPATAERQNRPQGHDRPLEGRTGRRGRTDRGEAQPTAERHNRTAKRHNRTAERHNRPRRGTTRQTPVTAAENPLPPDGRRVPNEGFRGARPAQGSSLTARSRAGSPETQTATTDS
ncbi:hypothetical protein JOD64_001777 [Micromonospora luteifusca]|uniref:Uncharacterized protein n=1 Tax=Micromonospora luteifusca TaxID=709860 RepID=A0ABS2LR05_9ACTN|nr:hypothetical protein [Micromonospora luteifusca]